MEGLFFNVNGGYVGITLKVPPVFVLTGATVTSKVSSADIETLSSLASSMAT